MDISLVMLRFPTIETVYGTVSEFPVEKQKDAERI